MSEEKLITRDLILICDKSLFDEIKDLAPEGKIKKSMEIYEKGLEKASTITDKVIKMVLPISKKRNDTIQVIPINYFKEFTEHDNIELKGLTNVSIGTLLVKHPFFPNTYISLDCLENDILHHKLLCLSSIAQFLGAKSISGHAIISEEQKRQKDLSGNLKYKTINLNSEVRNNENKKYESKYKIEDTFSGSFTKESYEHALKEARVFGLDKDIEICNLIDQRNPDHSMQISSRKLTIELSQELNTVLDLAFSAYASGIKINANYKAILEKRKIILFDMEIKF